MTAPRVRHLFYNTEKLKSSLDSRSVISLYSRHQAALDLFERDTRTAAYEAANRKRNLCAFALFFHGLTSRLLFLLPPAPSLAFDGAALPRAPLGTFPGQLTMYSSSLASGTSFSLALTRPRTETPAACTVSGSPETSGCHQ
jgi:hypothetical protein